MGRPSIDIVVLPAGEYCSLRRPKRKRPKFLSITHNLPGREEPGMEIVQFPKAAPYNDVTRRRVVFPCEISAEFCHFSQIVLHG